MSDTNANTERLDSLNPIFSAAYDRFHEALEARRLALTEFAEVQADYNRLVLAERAQMVDGRQLTIEEQRAALLAWEELQRVTRWERQTVLELEAAHDALNSATLYVVDARAMVADKATLESDAEVEGE
jgi:hypothetical protein